MLKPLCFTAIPPQNLAARIDSNLPCPNLPLQFLAKMATNLAKPRGVRVLPRRDVVSLLASTPATKIPGCGAGSVAARQFAALGVSSVLDLRRVQAPELRERLGEQLGVKASQAMASKPAILEQPYIVTRVRQF